MMTVVNNILVWGLTVALYFPIFWTLYKSRWEDIDYTHAYFILPCALLVCVVNRVKIKEAVRMSQPASGFSVLLMLIGLFMFVFGWRNDYLFISSLSLIPYLAGMILYLYGTKTLTTVRFPLLYLLLLMPIPLGILDSITVPMRYQTSIWTEHILMLFKYPITREGLLLMLDEHEIFMGAPCSGFRSLITMLSLGLLYVYFLKGRMIKNVILIVAIVPFALIGNLIRVLTLCLITYHIGEEVAQSFFHEFSGIVVFVVMILLLMATESILNKIWPEAVGRGGKA